MYRETNKATCRRFIQQLYNEGDLLSIRDFVLPDSVHHELDGTDVPSGRGPEWLADMIHLYRIAFPDLQVEVQDQIAETDRVVTCLRMQGTQTGPLLGIGMSGKTVDVTGIRVDRLADGMISESWLHWDSLGMLQQIGALPPLDRKPQTPPKPKGNASLPAPTPFPTTPLQAEMPLPADERLKPAA